MYHMHYIHICMYMVDYAAYLLPELDETFIPIARSKSTGSCTSVAYRREGTHRGEFLLCPLYNISVMPEVQFHFLYRISWQTLLAVDLVGAVNISSK